MGDHADILSTIKKFSLRWHLHSFITVLSMGCASTELLMDMLM